MKKSILVFLAIAACFSLNSCQTLGRSMQVPGNLLKAVGRSAGVVANNQEAPKSDFVRFPEVNSTHFNGLA